ncbi:MAG: hypothetical protein J7K26_02140 [Candidatus Aenigmarchaeota archaeon]|nr:hypothetical protein [Candidatus Aenigmarchaeota archaeon]
MTTFIEILKKIEEEGGEGNIKDVTVFLGKPVPIRKKYINITLPDRSPDSYDEEVLETLDRYLNKDNIIEMKEKILLMRLNGIAEVHTLAPAYILPAYRVEFLFRDKSFEMNPSEKKIKTCYNPDEEDIDKEIINIISKSTYPYLDWTFEYEILG